MKKKYIGVIFTQLIILSGCGGSSGSDSNDNPVVTKTGVLIDSPVENVTYETATQSGTTNSNGEFLYRDGEIVTFSIGSLVFPSVAAGETITPIDLAGATSITDQQATNIARLLQTLDRDGKPENGITIPNEAAAAAAPIDFDVDKSTFENYPSVINLVANHGGINSSLVSEISAQNHVNETLGGTINDRFSFQLYDDFSSGKINYNIWGSQDGSTVGSDLNIVNESLLAFAEKNDIIRIDRGLWVANPNSISLLEKQAFQADFAISDSTGDSTNRAQILLGFPFKVEGGVTYSVDTGINFYDTGKVTYFVEIFNDRGVESTAIATGELGEVEPNSTNTLTVALDGDNILFSLNDEIPASVPVDDSYSIDSTGSWAWAAVRGTSKDTGNGSVTVKIDNVKVGSRN